MMQEILKPLLENNVLTDEVKSSIETALAEAIQEKEKTIRAEVEQLAKENFESAKIKFEETYKTLEESYKTKLDEAKNALDLARNEIEHLESRIEELETQPFINVSESDLEAAEKKLVNELETKFEETLESTKEKLNNTFDLVMQVNSEILSELEEHIEMQEKIISELQETLERKEQELSEALEINSSVDERISEAILETEERMKAEAEEKIETLKENLVTSTEIFLEQELAEIKAEKDEIMKEIQGRELLETIKDIVKQYWDVDSEVAEEILEMKKETELKVEQYKDMLKKEHARLEEAQAEIEKLKKKVIVESRSAVLTSDKKEALEKLAENMDSEKLETNIDSLMESVIDAFNSGFSKNEIQESIENEVAKIESETNNQEILNESTQTVISSGDTQVEPSEELAEILSFAGVKK